MTEEEWVLMSEPPLWPEVCPVCHGEALHPQYLAANERLVFAATVTGLCATPFHPPWVFT